MSNAALSHLRVIDLTHHVAGPYCTKLLADFGAEVIKVERPGSGDPSRAMGPFPDDRADPEASGTFQFLNTNKRSITLNLKTVTGRRILEDLARNADVLVESFSPRVMPGLGLEYARLAAMNPRLVYTSISNFGQCGPQRSDRASEIVLDAAGGWMFGLGAPDREPIKPPGVQAQVVAGIFGSSATLTAVYARALVDRGQHVDVSIQEAVLWMLMNITSTFSYSGRVWQRDAGRSSMNHPQGLYEALDGLIGINVLYYVEWPRFAQFVGHPEWLDDPRLQTPLDRARNREVIDVDLRPWVRQQPKQALYEAAQRAKIPFALINTPADLLASSQLGARDYWVDQPVAMPGAPFKLSETPWQLTRPAPGLGEHTTEVLAEQLAFGEADVARLRERGVV